MGKNRNQKKTLQKHFPSKKKKTRGTEKAKQNEDAHCIWDTNCIDCGGAIGCVDFFVDIMIKSQNFSSRLPTVGGEVHIALIIKNDGFRFISREEYEHEGYAVSKEV